MRIVKGLFMVIIIVAMIFISVNYVGGDYFKVEGAFIKRVITKSVDEEKSASIEGISNIILDSRQMSIYVDKGTGDKVEFKLKGKMKATRDFKVPTLDIVSKDGTLYIDVVTDEEEFKNLSSYVDLTVKIPEAYSKSLDISNGFGNISIQDTIYDVLKVKASMGDIRLKNLSWSDGTFDNSMGNLTISECVGKIVASMSMGDFEILTPMADSIKVKNGMGDVRVCIDEKSNFTYSAETSMGEIDSNDDSIRSNDSGMSRRVKGSYGDDESTYNIDINVSSGDVEFLIK